MSTKAEIFNLALSALLIIKTIADTENDTSSENRTLNVNWKNALAQSLQDMDLDATAMRKPLELIQKDPVKDWHFAYKYPGNCIYFRRILPMQQAGSFTSHRIHKDIRSTQVKREIATFNNQKVIFTNEHEAIGQFIPDNLPLNILSAHATQAIAYKLAILSAPLISGKGAAALRKELKDLYNLEKASAQEHDRLENATFDEDFIMSEFVQARLS